MIIYPAIDLRGGKVVRLREGDPNQQTIFSEQPLETAQRWIADGAKWIHVVNLDGAFNQANHNLNVLEAIARLSVSVQFGGGLRSLADIEHAFERGAQRVVLGTVALKEPHIVYEAIRHFGSEAICVGLDARDGFITTHGWTETATITPTALGLRMAEMGVRHALFTDVSRDGALSGSNVQATIELAEQTHLQVIASGGVATLDELMLLAKSGVVAGAVIGMALYTNQFTLQEAIQLTERGYPK
ncbi:MAG: 1-(5-phosphoribosyl)-5-[(5-phosphoribosylamino)methylideneamino]imidazole-4-carboxamide isomerase [Phototrophicaceae bacterium]